MVGYGEGRDFRLDPNRLCFIISDHAENWSARNFHSSGDGRNFTGGHLDSHNQVRLKILDRQEYFSATKAKGPVRRRALVLLFDSSRGQTIPKSGCVTQHQPVGPLVTGAKQRMTFSQSVDYAHVGARRLAFNFFCDGARGAYVARTKRQCQYQNIHYSSRHFINRKPSESVINAVTPRANNSFPIACPPARVAWTARAENVVGRNCVSSRSPRGIISGE